MSASEIWSVVNAIIGNCLLLAAVLAAFYVGLKQNEISARQTQISERLFDLEYELSIDLNYDIERKVFTLENRSKHNIYYGGVRFSGSGPLEEKPREIPVGGKQEIRRHQDYNELAPAEGVYSEPVNFYLMDQRKVKYILHAEVSVRNQAGKVQSVDIRRSSPTKEEWGDD